MEIPENFYARVAELHEQKELATKTEKMIKLNVEGIPETEALYFDDYTKTECKAKVLRIIKNNVILDRTVALPTSGGQLHDLGAIDNEQFADVFKQGSVIVHVLKEPGKNLKEGKEVTVRVDKERRDQLAQHHTATHIVNAAAKRILGSHSNQAGARKTVEKATIDITHYQSLSEQELEAIEKEANRIIAEKIPVYLSFKPRTEAEKTYGMAIYQGGAVPGKQLRIVEIPEVDTEACGGTHLKNTFEAGKIKLIKSSKISDAIVRIEFTAGMASAKELSRESAIIKEAAALLNCEENQVPARAEELFTLWKKAVKKKKQVGSKELNATATFEGDILAKTAETLKTQPGHIIKTIKRFWEELKG